MNDELNGGLYLSFCYCTGLIAVAGGAGQTASSLFTVGADAAFRCHYVTITVLQANVVVETWGGTIKIDDASPQRSLMNVAIPVDALRGNGGRPYELKPPRMFQKSTTVTIQLTNNVATATDVYIVFHGNKVLE